MTRILCLDDDQPFLKLLQRILEWAGYECLATDDNQEALSIMRTQSIDLLTQDIVRPGMDGFEFLSVMKSDEALRNIPVLFITGGTRIEERAEQLRQFGLDFDRDLAGYIIKPVGRVDLLDAIEAVLEEHSKPSPPK